LNVFNLCLLFHCLIIIFYNMNILITGIQGYVGNNLVDKLKKEHTLYGLDIVTSQMDGVEKTYTIAELSTIPNVDIVIHLAGKANETNNLSEALAYFETNAGLTRNIFNWFAQSSAKTFIFFSSVKAVAESVKDTALIEDVDPKPFGALGESKLLAEKYILSQYVLGKNVYVLRPCYIYGNGRIGNKYMRWMYKWVISGYPFPFGKFKCNRSFLAMDNLIFILKQMMVKNIPSGIYNIADDGYLSAVEIFEIMGSVLGKKVRIWRLSKGFINALTRIGRPFHLNFDGYLCETLLTNFVVSNEKIKKALNIKKLPVSTVDGLTKAIQGYKNQINTK